MERRWPPLYARGVLSRPVRAILLLLFTALLLAVAACGRKGLRLTPVANQRPLIELSQAPATTDRPFHYSYDVFWTSFDPDGRVERYLYCVDPPTRMGADTPWVATTQNRVTLLLESSDPDSMGTPDAPGGFHVFVVKAVDDKGMASAPAICAFFSYTVAPTVEFVQPKASHLIHPMVPSTTTFTITGTDPDGPVHRRPSYYRYRLFSDQDREFDFFTMLTNPDSLRRRYAPTFASWESVSGDTCRLRIEKMLPEHDYVLAVVAVDEAGAYTPVFTYDTNLLLFRCQFPGRFGPCLTIWNEFFSYAYTMGMYNPDPVNYLRIEVPAGQPISFNWRGVAQSGAALKSYRWAMDLTSLDDETPRTNERTDWSHWSVATSVATSATVGPFGGTGPDSLEQHLFYIEAEDDNGLKSLAIVQLRVLRLAPQKPLLFVDDTRLTLDYSQWPLSDSIITPGGTWPSAAELDTFLFARGGVRWRYYQPATQLSFPGVFAGYDFDTIGTRGQHGGLVPLSILCGYANVVWYCDQARAFTQAPLSQVYPMTALRYLCGPGQTNTLGLYSRMGGRTWLMGGGFAYNSLAPYNVTSNDVGGVVFANPTNELVPGRLMHSLAHWQSEITVKAPRRALRNAGLAPTWPGAPDYSLLPERLLERTAATDPVPPERGAGMFYLTSYTGEVLTRPNVVAEGDPGEPAAAVLDTLYFAYGGNAGADLPVMTYYHGAECGPVVFSGFPLWYFQRAQVLQVADFVLQRLWGLSRAPVPR